MTTSLLWLWVVAASGCGTGNQGLVIDQNVRARSLLVSEVEAAEDRTTLLDCPIRVKNRSRQPRQITLAGTGCSCYGVALDGKPVAVKESFTVAPGKELTFRMVAVPPNAQSEKEYTLTFETPGPNDEPVAIPVSCHIDVYQNINLTPGVMTCEAPPGEAVHQAWTMAIANVFRSQDGAAPKLDFGKLPDFAKLVALERMGEPERLTDGLWRQRWTAQVGVALPAEHSESIPPASFQVRASDSSGKLLASRSGQFVVHVPRSIAYPSRVHFGKLHPGEIRQRRILVTSTDDAPFELRSDDVLRPKFVTVEIDAESKSKHWVQLAVEVDRSGSFSAPLTLRTSDPRKPLICIDLEGQVEADGD
jgi:hypothetical protein